MTAIGGLDLKIMGGINGGVTTFIFPKDNIKDFNDFMDKNGTKDRWVMGENKRQVGYK